MVNAIVTITNRIGAAGKGWILDGFPYTSSQAFLLEKSNFQPHYIFHIDVPEETIADRAKQDLMRT